MTGPALEWSSTTKLMSFELDLEVTHPHLIYTTVTLCLTLLDAKLLKQVTPFSLTSVFFALQVFRHQTKPQSNILRQDVVLVAANLYTLIG